MYLVCFLIIIYTFQLELVGSFNLSCLFPDQPWAQVSPLLSPDTCLHFVSRIHLVQHAPSFSVFIKVAIPRFRGSGYLDFGRKRPYEDALGDI